MQMHKIEVPLVDCLDIEQGVHIQRMEYGIRPQGRNVEAKKSLIDVATIFFCPADQAVQAWQRNDEVEVCLLLIHSKNRVNTISAESLRQPHGGNR